jgi:hypothetical protein
VSLNVFEYGLEKYFSICYYLVPLDNGNSGGVDEEAVRSVRNFSHTKPERECTERASLLTIATESRYNRFLSLRRIG